MPPGDSVIARLDCKSFFLPPEKNVKCSYKVLSGHRRNTGTLYEIDDMSMASVDYFNYLRYNLDWQMTWKNASISNKLSTSY